MKIKITNYDITAKAEISPDSNIWEVTDAIGGLLQVVGFGKDTISQAIRDEDEVQDLWLVPTEENLEKWAGNICLFEGINSSGGTYYYLASPSGDWDSVIPRFIPIATLCG